MISHQTPAIENKVAIMEAKSANAPTSKTKKSSSNSLHFFIIVEYISLKQEPSLSESSQELRDWLCLFRLSIAVFSLLSRNMGNRICSFLFLFLVITQKVDYWLGLDKHLSKYFFKLINYT